MPVTGYEDCKSIEDIKRVFREKAAPHCERTGSSAVFELALQALHEAYGLGYQNAY